MSTLVILMCSVTFAKAALPLMDAMNTHVYTTENILNAIELRFEEESIRSVIKTREAVMDIYGDTFRNDRNIIRQIRHEWEIVNERLMEPAQKYGINVTECQQLYNDLRNCQKTISARVKFCTDEIIESIDEQLKNMEKRADQVKKDFSRWTTAIHLIPATVDDFASLEIAVATLRIISGDAQTSVDNNYLPNLRANVNSVEELKVKHRECFRPNEDIFNYEIKYLSLWSDSQKCIRRLTTAQAMEVSRHIMETGN